MSDRVRVTSLDAIEEIPVVGGSLRWKPVRRALGIEAFGMNAYVANAGYAVVEEHDERTDNGSGSGGHQEVYLVARGHARFSVDGEEIDAPAGSLVFLPDPGAKRSAIALEDGTTVVAVGADPAVSYSVSAWEYCFAAEADVARGDFAAAAETVRGALPEHQGNPSVHYNLACYLARAGELEEAIIELRRAMQADPARIRALAAEDDDLDAIRDLTGYPAG
jgi:quercetin dioxygenase-like cupin family protein